MLGPASSMPSKPSLDPVLKDWSIENIHMRCLCSCGAERPISTYTLIEKLGA